MDDGLEAVVPAVTGLDSGRDAVEVAETGREDWIQLMQLVFNQSNTV